MDFNFSISVANCSVNLLYTLGQNLLASTETICVNPFIFCYILSVILPPIVHFCIKSRITCLLKTLSLTIYHGQNYNTLHIITKSTHILNTYGACCRIYYSRILYFMPRGLACLIYLLCRLHQIC